MRWVIFAGILIVVTGGGYYLYRSTHGSYEGASGPARMDQGVPVKGEGRIDPHANVGGAKASSPLRIVSRLLGSSSAGAQIDVVVSTLETFTHVSVEAERFDQANALEPAWKTEIWSGALQPGAAHRVQVNVPLGAQPPLRILISAHAQSPAGARFGAMDIVDLGKHGGTPESQPATSGGAVEYPGHTDSAHARP